MAPRQKVDARMFLKRIRDNLNFLREYQRNRKLTGAITSSSPALAEAMVSQIFANLSADDSPRKILEVGCGDGVITERIYRSLRPQDQLTVVEINAHFCELTRRRIDRVEAELEMRAAANHGQSPPRPQFTIINKDVLTYGNDPGETGDFDAIACSLPFNNFDPGLVMRIFSHIFMLARPEGTVSFFEYILLRRMRIWASFGRETKLAVIEAIVTDLVTRFGCSRKAVWGNVPPAMVYTMRAHVSRGAKQQLRY